MQNNQSIMQISENKDGSAKVLFRIRKAEMTDVDEIMAVMHEAKNDKEHPDWFVSDDEEYVRTHIEEQGFVIVAQTADGSVAGFFIIKYPENREDNLGTYLDFDEEQLSHVAVMDSAVVCCAYRGNGLQGHMLEEAERLLDTDQYYYFTVSIPSSFNTEITNSAMSSLPKYPIYAALSTPNILEYAHRFTQFPPGYII